MSYIQSKHNQPKAKNANDVSEIIELPDINLNKVSQLELLKIFEKFYDDLPFPEQKNKNCRYYFNQNFFCYADAIFLYSFLRHTLPKQIIEIGSGFSSAVILDSVEKFFDYQPEITFIEPNPDRLQNILKPQDKVRIINRKVQELPIDVFISLNAEDLLLIDSSHVIKCGSDLQFLFFDIIPHLQTGVFVHFHDIFYPFEYPAGWILNGRHWNEGYFLRAFLAYNDAWKIYFFNDFVAIAFKSFLAEKMPLCLKNSGGSLYIQKVHSG